MNRAQVLLQSLLVALGTGAVSVPPAQGGDWFSAPGYGNSYYDPETARRATIYPPPPRRRPDRWREDWRTYPERWRGEPYWRAMDPWVVRERKRQHQRMHDIQRMRELEKTLFWGSDP